MIKTRDNNDYWVYNIPEAPPQLDTIQAVGPEEYKWNFEFVSIWSSHLDPAHNTTIDISPASMGNIQSFPTNFT